jgi:ubiquinone/menaquinone biosynthesis C-methylase UbiE
MRTWLTQLWRSERPTRVATREGYDRWAPVYPARPHNPVMEAEAAIVAPLMALAAPARALDVGTGTGRNLELLRLAGARYVAGIDRSAAMLAHGSGQFPRVRADAERLPFMAQSFDVVASSLMCGDLPDLSAWIGEAARVLTRAGHLIYSDLHPSWSESGWRRTFTAADGKQYELPYFAHTIEEHVAILGRHGLAVRAIREPRVPNRPTPVAVVLHAVKASSGL